MTPWLARFLSLPSPSLIDRSFVLRHHLLACNSPRDSNTEILKSDIKNIFLKYLVEIMKNVIRTATIIILPTLYNNTAEDLDWSSKSKGNKEKIRPLENLVPAWRNEYIIIVFELFPTPPDTPLKYLFTAVLITAMPKNTLSKSPLSMWEYKFESV